VQKGHHHRNSRRRGHDTVVFIAWYRPEQWRQLCEVSTDIKDETYQQWLEAAQRGVEQFPHGLEVKKIDVDVEELVQWCNGKGMKVNAEARSRFAAERGRRCSAPSPLNHTAATAGFCDARTRDP
jgi:hypothetical protein